MADIRMTIRNPKGDIVGPHHDAGFKLSWEGLRIDLILNRIKQLPKYTRGAVKYDLMFREVPNKERYNSYSDVVELVISEAQWNRILVSESWLDEHYDDGGVDQVQLVEPVLLPFLTLRQNLRYQFYVPALFALCERQLCQSLRSPSSLSDLEEARDLHTWLTSFQRSTDSIGIRIESGSLERKWLYVRVGTHERRICELSYDQKRIYKASTRVHLATSVIGSIRLQEEIRDRLLKVCEKSVEVAHA